MPAAKDITGQRFGKLVAVEWTGKSVVGGREWLFKCDCGNEVKMAASIAASGNTKSCGCLKADVLLERNFKHGYSKTKEYMSWKDAKKRCYNESNKRYANYGAIGIYVYEKWKTSFEAFIDHIGWMPKDGNKYTLGRIDNRLSYIPGNVEWQLDAEQARAHGLQKNNTTGVVGVFEKTTTINGVPYKSYAASISVFKKKTAKEFSWNKYGKEQAFRLACEWREQKIKELEVQGIFYHESHGKPKGIEMNDSQ